MKKRIINKSNLELESLQESIKHVNESKETQKLFKEEVNMKKKIKETSIGERIAKLVSEEFAGQCGPFGEEDPILKGNKMGLYSQNATIWYTFNDDGSIDVDYSEDDEDLESTMPTHYASLKDLFLSADGWFYSREADAEELLAKVEDILGGDDALIENVASDKTEEKSLGFNMDKLLKTFKKLGFEVTSAKMDENDFYDEFGYPWHDSWEFKGNKLIAYKISIKNIFDEDDRNINAGVWVQSGSLEPIGDFSGSGAYDTVKEVIVAIKREMKEFDYHLDEGPDALVEDYYDVNSVAKEIANKLSLSTHDRNMLIHDINNLRGIEWLDQVKSIGDESLLDMFKDVAQLDLDEDIEKHDTLNPKLFDGEELKPEVKETIEKIANTFMEELANDGIKFTLKDIILLGSNVSYNYTKDSDLDIHLVADSSGLHCPDDLYPLLYSAYRSMFNKNYDITIKGIPSEIYVEMDNVQAKSNGIYSLNKGWIKKPVQTSIPDLDKEAFDKLFTEWEDRYFDLIKDKDLDESYRLDTLKTIFIPTGLYGKDDLNILNSLIGQLSDGMWENSSRMEKYWKYMDFKEGPDGEIFIRVPTDYRWTFNLESSQDLRNWIAKHLKAVVKAFIKDNPNIDAEWKRDCLTPVDYLDDYPVQDIYRIYDKLLQRKDRIEKDAYIEALHPEKDLGWIGKGKKHLVDADTFTTAHDGDIIKVHILDGLPDLEYEISDGSYLDNEGAEDLPEFRDCALTADPTNSSIKNFFAKLDNLISNAVKKSILDLLKEEYKEDFVFNRGITTNYVIPRVVNLYNARLDRRIPAILSDKEDIVESLSDNEKTLFDMEKELGRKLTTAEYKEFLYPKMLKFYDDFLDLGFTEDEIKKEMKDAFYYDDLIKKVFDEKTKDVYIESTINEAKSDDIFDFITELYNLRKESIANEGEYGLGNLVFKEFRNLGYLDNLKKLRRDEKSKELSLESIKK